MNFTREWAVSYKFPDYEVSVYGGVRELATGIYLNTIVKNTDIYVIIKDQYGEYVRVSLDRLVAMTFLGGDRPDMLIRHKDGNRQNNQVDNLEWVPDLKRSKHEIYSTLPIRCIDTGVVYDCIYDCSEEIDVKPSAIYKCIGSKCLAVTRDRLRFEWAN